MADNSQLGLIRLKDTDLVVAGEAADVRGRTAVDRSGQEIGEIDGLLVDAEQQRIRFLQVASGGFLGIGEKKRLIPVDAVTRVEADRVTIDQDRQHVADAPLYDPDLEEMPDRGFFDDVYGHYGYAPYWRPGYMYPAYPYY